MLPKDLGGLAVRDLAAVNESMLMKSLWKIAQGAHCQWVELVKGKYILNSRLWLSKRLYRCTNF